MKKEIIPCSVGILTYNSERYLARCLDSLSGFGEIIVSDGGSTDKTLEIAQKYNCKIIKQIGERKPIDDFSRERNHILAKAEFDWFFYLDSDEIMSSELKDRIRGEATKEENNFQLFKVRYCLVGEKMQIYRSFKSYYQIRLFRRSSGAFFIKKMHERIFFDEKKFQVGVIDEPWFVPLNINLNFSIYKNKVQSRIREMLKDKHYKNFQEFLIKGWFPNFGLLFKQIFKTFYLHLRYKPKEVVPLRYEFFRIYSNLFTLKEVTVNFFIRRPKS